jgi:hypothetical protein
LYGRPDALDHADLLVAGHVREGQGVVRARAACRPRCARPARTSLRSRC